MALQKGARLLTPFAGCGIDLPRSGGGARNALTPGYCLSRLRREIHLSTLQAGGGVPPVGGAGGCPPASGSCRGRGGRSVWPALVPSARAARSFAYLFLIIASRLAIFMVPGPCASCVVAVAAR